MNKSKSSLVNEVKPLIEFSREVHAIAAAKGHALVWNIKDPAKHIGKCACGLISEVVMDGSDTLTESGTLKQCRMSERNSH